MFLLPLFGLSACGDSLNAVSIQPIYGWVDGCTTVTIQGNGFGTDVNADIGGVRVSDVAPPADPTDVGYAFTATMPKAEAPGYADVTVYSKGKQDTITGSGAYYYVACPSPAHVDALGLSSALYAQPVTIHGCNLDPTLMRVRLVSADRLTVSDDLTPATGCGTASMTFAVPVVPPGAYAFQVVDLAGTVLDGELCPQPSGSDTGGTTDTATPPAEPCATEIPFTVEAAR